jgi:TolB-like protein
VGLALAVFGALATLLFWFLVRDSAPSNDRVVIAVSVFDNETGNPDYDRPVAGLSDLVVAHLTTIDPARVAVVGNAAILRQPRNIRNLKAVGESVRADYVLLGQLQSGETGLRFITHFIRLQDEAHLKANRLTVEDATLAGLEAAVVEEFDRAVRLHILGRASN